MNNTKELAINKWHDILAHFIPEKLLTGQHCACPVCGGKDRFRFDNKDGHGTFFCSKCGSGSGIHLLSLVLNITYKDAWRKVEEVVGKAEERLPKKEYDRKARIKNILSACTPIVSGGWVEQYLHSRGIFEIPDSLMEAESSKGSIMMVAKFAVGKKLAGLHVTFVRDGKKDESDGASRKMFGLNAGGLNGAAIRLHQLNGSARIVVGEGIETTLSAAKRFGAPGWATGSAGLLERLIVPPEITEVLICGDNDLSFTGQAAAFNLAKRLTMEKKKCIIHIPNYELNPIQSDWNDVKN